jgi:hypothetical protein
MSTLGIDRAAREFSYNVFKKIDFDVKNKI